MLGCCEADGRHDADLGSLFAQVCEEDVAEVDRCGWLDATIFAAAGFGVGGLIVDGVVHGPDVCCILYLDLRLGL